VLVELDSGVKSTKQNARDDKTGCKAGRSKDNRGALANSKKPDRDAEFEPKKGVRAVVILFVPDHENAHGGLI
jgi:hypothetical protein